MQCGKRLQLQFVAAQSSLLLRAKAIQLDSQTGINQFHTLKELHFQVEYLIINLTE